MEGSPKHAANYKDATLAIQQMLWFPCMLNANNA